MAPTLVENDYVLAIKRFRKLRVGDIVVVEHPLYKSIIKRVEIISDDGRIRVSGDNPASVTSEEIGWLDEVSVKSRVYLIFRPDTLPEFI